MRPLSFENLRRLVGRKKDRNEPSFKRSESFKRISIRKSYLDRGKRRSKLQKSLEPTVPATAVDPGSNEKISQQRIKEEEVKRHQKDALDRDSISYDEWLQGVGSSIREKHEEEYRPSQQFLSRNKNCKYHKQNEADIIADDFKVLELDASPILSSKSYVGSNERTIEDKSARDILQIQEHVGEGPPSVSISLGRIWREAVPVPYPSSSGPSHHSLDSALKERKPQPTVARTVSAPEKSANGVKDAASSSSFGFSFKITKLTEFRSGLLSSSPPNGQFLYCLRVSLQDSNWDCS
ncbi:hypothetical protein KM043_010787 [Ampulex compressa]|nr:hypothetical protein KM043_010787 [Ampulex compressa]